MNHLFQPIQIFILFIQRLLIMLIFGLYAFERMRFCRRVVQLDWTIGLVWEDYFGGTGSHFLLLKFNIIIVHRYII
jgi:hypothetical protein